jgi:hypothetical protein
MKRLISFSVLFIFALFSTTSLSLTAAARAETLVGSNADNRLTVALSVRPEAAQAWLPAPWQVEPLSKGPFKGSNLGIVCIDRLLNQDPEGEPAGGGTFRLVALYVPAKHPQTGESAPFIIRVYGPHTGSGPYKNSVQATVRREATTRGAGFDPGTGNEWWLVQAKAGGTLEFQMNYRRALPKRSRGEARPHSNIDPTFFRMYRYDQLMDVVKSIPDDIDRVKSHHLRVTIPELRELFNGSEQLVGIALVPWYGRQTFLP